MITDYDRQVAQWHFDVACAEENLKDAKKSRNYYEGQRKKLQRELDRLLANDPRQMRMEFENETR